MMNQEPDTNPMEELVDPVAHFIAEMLRSRDAHEEWEFFDEELSDDEDNGAYLSLKARACQQKERVFAPEESPYMIHWIIPADADATKSKGVWDDESYYGKRFCRFFRVPYFIFDLLHREFIKETEYTKGAEKQNSKFYDTRLYLLGVLRVLATNLPFYYLKELNGISENANHVFFQGFVAWGSSKADAKIKFPSTPEDIRHVTGYYDALGLPGCVGSMDCVHLEWDACPAGLKNDCMGRYKTPTLAFQAICSHTRRILHVSTAYFGSRNDRHIVKNDPGVENILDGLVSNFQWATQNSNNELQVHKGLYVLVDGGYFSWKIMMTSPKMPVPGTAEAEWAVFTESLRKDIECVFGILKKGFLILRGRAWLRDIKTVERIFKTCCLLHNMLLDYDGCDDWESEGLGRMDFPDAAGLVIIPDYDMEKFAFEKRRACLVEHYEAFKEYRRNHMDEEEDFVLDDSD